MRCGILVIIQTQWEHTSIVVPRKTVFAIFCKTEITYVDSSMTSTWNTWVAIRY